MNAEFQIIARRDKKDFLSDQCKEIEENNRMGKTRDLFKKIENIKRIFSPKMGTIKDINGRDLVEVKRSRKDGRNTWKSYTEKILMNQITTMVWSATQSQIFWGAKSSGP